MFFKIVVLKNFVIFTRKDLYWRLFLLNKEGLQIYKKEIPTQVFPVDIVKFLRTSFFIEHPGGCFSVSTEHL